MPKRTAPSYGYATEQSSPAQMAQSPWPRQRTVPGSVWNEPPAAPASGSATEQPLPTRPAPRNTQPHRQTLPTTAPTPETTVQASVRNEPRAAPAGGSATEQPLPAPTLEPAMQARLELETLEKRAQEHELSDSEIELALDRILKPEDFLQESQEGAAPTAAAAATEHSEETTSLPAEKQLIYSIVNAFLNKMTFHHPQAEELLVAALNDETCLNYTFDLLPRARGILTNLLLLPKWLERSLGVGAARYQPIHSPVVPTRLYARNGDTTCRCYRARHRVEQNRSVADLYKVHGRYEEDSASRSTRKEMDLLQRLR